MPTDLRKRDDPYEKVRQVLYKLCRESYGERALARVISTQRIDKRLKVWLSGAIREITDPEDVGDVEYAAEEFLRFLRLDFESAFPTQAGTPPTRSVASSSGSLTRVATYADVLPRALRARQEILGTREALSFGDAIRWLKERTEGADNKGLAMVNVTYRFLVPQTTQALEAKYALKPGLEYLAALDKASIPARIAPGLHRPVRLPREQSILLLIEDDNGQTKIDLFRSDSEEVLALIWWADCLAAQCAGEASSRRDVFEAKGFEIAVWLILAGRWPCRAGKAVLEPFSFARLGDDGDNKQYGRAPRVVVRIESLDTPPEAISAAYKDLQRVAGFGRRGPKMTSENEILCLAALDAREIAGVHPENKGYIGEVLRRYKLKAEMYTVETNAFPLTRRGKDKARKALRRAGLQ